MARNEFFINTTSADFVIDLMSKYILPMLYGLLGAVTFILRTLTRHIKEHTYHKGLPSEFSIRLTLGCISGIASGLILQSDQELNNLGLSTLGLCFLIGYSIEVLFSNLDALAQKAKAPLSKTAASET
ncbi:MAG: hypothetical protein HRT88_07520 [Lentisphaeraceae bacterium]|nr:hypothetical protein [Lentisphaeraceae bacterium]